jgi:N utilization substance protein A
LVDSTPENFGRSAAQTAKQVILQRVREAEREKLFEDFSAREGEIVNGTVQSVTGQHIAIGLGRTEAVLPKSQQVPGERYRAHDKIRVYVLEVRRTSKGPQIVVSRNHRSLLRRLLELEVPEIYTGQVEIKSIAREAGARSKVAVMAMQPGIDPVGACVGMRGVRIRSIVRELNDEKIDVIEWDPDQKTFIAKALSPARVAQVFLEDHPTEGKTAIVIVPDDQLSLAIGREGQNARLAAKLTGWRIDIKSLTEAAGESLTKLDHPTADPAVARNKELVEQVQLILAKKETNRPVTAEDYLVLNRFVSGVEGRIVATRAAEYDRVNKARTAARKLVPESAWQITLESVGLSEPVFTALHDGQIVTLGELIMNLELGEENLVRLEGFGDKALEEVKAKVADFLAQEAAAALSEEVAQLDTEAQPDAISAEDMEALAEEAAPPAEAEEELLEAEEEAPVEELEMDMEAAIEDLARPLVSAEPAVKPEKDKKRVVVVQPSRTTPADKDDKDKVAPKGKELVFDEARGKVVVKRKRKGTRRRADWEGGDDLEDDDPFADKF